MAKATHSLTFPVSGDAFSIANFNNAFNALHQGDLAPMRPRAHSVANMGIMIASSLSQGYYGNVYTSGDFYSVFASGDVSFTAPSTNSRIDLVYASGDIIRVTAGSQAASPVAPTFPRNKNCIPIALIYHRVGETKIVNYEDSGANPTHGYIYRDVRPLYNFGNSGSYTVSFVSGDTSASVLTVNHNLGTKYVSLSVYDSGDQIVLPNSITGTSVNASTVNLTGFPILGTWNIRAVA